MSLAVQMRRQREVSFRRQFDWLLLLACAALGLLGMPIAYAVATPEIRGRSLLDVALTTPVILPAMATTVAMVLAVRLKGRIDQRIAAGLSRAVFVHGVIAAAILVMRLEYSNQIIIISTITSVIACTCVVLVKQAAFPEKIAAVPGCPQHLNAGREVIHLADISQSIDDIDSLLTPDITSLAPEWVGRVSEAMLAGVPVRHFADYVEERQGLTSVDHFDPSHLPSRGLTSYESAKRVVDIVLVVLTAPFAVPLLVLGALAVFLTMGRPVFFVQSRAGLGGRPFSMVKLRTMRPPSPEEISMPTNASNDFRITSIGRFLRKYRIDELPQLWNVIRGEMSVVGPRPEWIVLSERYVREFPIYAYRHLARPGITGWAQVRSGYAADLEETRTKVGYDLFYIKNLSFGLDLQILLRTVWTLATASGAR